MEKSETIFFPVFSQNFILKIIHILLWNKNAQIQKIMLTPLVIPKSSKTKCFHKNFLQKFCKMFCKFLAKYVQKILQQRKEVKVANL